MRLTQGTFSYLPPLTADETAAQVRYCIANGWAVSVEHTDDPHPRNALWELWRLPLFDPDDAAPVLREADACRQKHPDDYVRISAYDRSYGRQTTALSFLVHRPSPEPALRLERTTGSDRRILYTLRLAPPLPRA